MYCPECGTLNPDQAHECTHCNGPIPMVSTIHSESIEDIAGMRMLLPIGRSWWAMAAGYLGLVSILVLPAPFALACGIIGIVDIRRNPKKHGMGRCLFGIIAGGIVSAILIFVICVAAFSSD